MIVIDHFNFRKLLKFIKNIETWGVLYIINLKVKEWQLPQLSSDPGTVLLLESVGYVSDGSFAFVDPHVVRPVLYLTSSAKITGGGNCPM